MNIRLRVHRWVTWWFYVGIVCGAIAVVNLLGHHLTPAQDRLLIILGAAHWVLGGIVCWAFEGIAFEQKQPKVMPLQQAQSDPSSETRSYAASEFLYPGRRQSLLRWRH